jgi:hypothetical protein
MVQVKPAYRFQRPVSTRSLNRFTLKLMVTDLEYANILKLLSTSTIGQLEQSSQKQKMVVLRESLEVVTEIADSLKSQ